MAESDEVPIISSLNNGNLHKTRDRAAFDIQYRDGTNSRASMDLADVENMVVFLLGLCQWAEQQKPTKRRSSGVQTTTLNTTPLEPFGVGFAPGRGPGETLMALDFGRVSLAFALDPNALQTLRAALGQMGQPTPPKPH